jgi:hypothetical protein
MGITHQTSREALPTYNCATARLFWFFRNCLKAG